ncbi:MAG: hypothetical protein JJ908_12040 [Rhizobiales bacterium]|nr:hypothetical protein [Hyphomicrobiales bacterium]MBO6699555.1 hypothetical protein [Hyphomicrobiales bacterium]MBO6737093.1 hypothetical protein [Hyphomicrobiales bacterium]MBO6911833.1 hypothetical protein [Hyphomicrobiales bacterium]MBO6954770.1 hypothetical protein [Hyphomicrobiales bacterium]
MHPMTNAALTGLFTQWNKGRLKPLPFALLFTVAMTATYLFSFVFLATIGSAAALESSYASSAGRTYDALPWDSASLWLSVTLLGMSVAACGNVMAKRIRDMGLPGGLATCMLGIMMLVFIGGGSTLQWATNLFVFSVFVALLTIPTDRLEAGSGLPKPRDGNGQR